MSIFSIFTSPSTPVKTAKPTPKPQAQPQPRPKADQPLAEKQPGEVQAKAREILLEAKDEAFKIREAARQDAESLRTDKQKLIELQARLQERDRLTQEQLGVAQKRLEETDQLKAKLLQRLEDVAGLTQTEAQDQLLKVVEKKSVVQIAKLIKDGQIKAREEADTQAREILIDAMRAGATDYVAEYTVSTIKLPDDEAKGRIIGKEGRNIRIFEQATGVDLDLDEPGVIKLSCFDSVRREIARVALERLIKDGRIHPAHIEEYVARAKRDIETTIYRAGEELCHAIGVYDLPKELIALLGRFRYRSSYGQNMIAHTLEETKIGVKLAQEVGADVRIVRLGCLLHDIGKVVEGEGSHVELGVKVAKKFNLAQSVVDCIAQHHEDEEFTSPEAIAVYIADAISGARPGARHENYEEYIQRLDKLESIAKSHEGVAEAYAIQAGREVRVIVNPEKITDAACVKLAEDIREEIENSLTYPGTVKVHVIREVRASSIAK